MANHITVLKAELDYVLLSEGFTPFKINQFFRIFREEPTDNGVFLQLDANRAMLINANGFGQGLDLCDFIQAWWAFWVVVFNNNNNKQIEQQAIGAIRSLFFISGHVRNAHLTQSMHTWWSETSGQHNHKDMETWNV